MYENKNGPLSWVDFVLLMSYSLYLKARFGCSTHHMKQAYIKNLHVLYNTCQPLESDMMLGYNAVCISAGIEFRNVLFTAVD